MRAGGEGDREGGGVADDAMAAGKTLQVGRLQERVMASVEDQDDCAEHMDAMRELDAVMQGRQEQARQAQDMQLVHPDGEERTQSTNDMSPQRTVNRICRPSLLKLPPVSNRMKVDTNRRPMVYNRAQCTGGSSRQAVACRSLCAWARRWEACRMSPTSVPARLYTARHEGWVGKGLQCCQPASIECSGLRMGLKWAAVWHAGSGSKGIGYDAEASA